MRPSGASAVMAAHAPGEIGSDSDREALWRQLDYFPTPPWAARAGAELIRNIHPSARTVWEPACGEGHMAAALRESFEVIASDIHPFGYGAPFDFLGEAPDWSERECADGFYADWIVTNPPFRTAAEFARLGLERARAGVALLLRLQFLEGCGRHDLMFGATMLSACAVFAERVPMTLGRWDPAAASATAYAWFIWTKGERRTPRLLSIPPGTKARLTRPDDAARFGVRREAGLLEAMEAGPDDDDDGQVNDVMEAAE